MLFKKENEQEPKMVVVMFDNVDDVEVEGFRYPQAKSKKASMCLCDEKTSNEFKEKWARSNETQRYILNLYNGVSISLDLSHVANIITTPIKSDQELLDFMDTSSYKHSGLEIEGLPDGFLNL